MSTLSGDDRTAQQESAQQKQKGPEAFLTGEERKDLQRMLSYPEDLPPKFKTWISEWIAINGLSIPISSIVGFQRFEDQLAAQDAAIAAAAVTLESALDSSDDSTTSTSYVDLGGPSLAGLTAGQYVLLYGCRVQSNNTVVHYYSPSINGAAASDADALQGRGPLIASLARAKITTLTEGSTIAMRYRVDTSTGGFGDRWIVAVRVGA